MVRPMVVRRVVKYGLFVWGYDAVSDTGQWVVVISVCVMYWIQQFFLYFTLGGVVCVPYGFTVRQDGCTALRYLKQPEHGYSGRSRGWLGWLNRFLSTLSRYAAFLIL